MRRTLTATLALTAAAVATTAGVLATPAAAGPTTVFRTALTGAEEVPGPGDPDGKGNAVIRVDGSSGEICYTVTTHDVAPLLAGHLHVGAAGAAGPVVQGFVPAATTGYRMTEDSFRGCVVNAPLAAALLSNPSGYYVNVHNAEYPGGALRGQLG